MLRTWGGCACVNMKGEGGGVGGVGGGDGGSSKFDERGRRGGGGLSQYMGELKTAFSKSR